MSRSRFVGCLAGTALSALVEAQAPVLGPEFVVNAATQGYQREPAVANLGPNGDFLVIWRTYEHDTDTDKNLMGRRFSAAAVPLDETDFVVNSGPGSVRFLTRVASNEAGNFVVTWTESYGEEPGWGVRARRFDVRRGRG